MSKKTVWEKLDEKQMEQLMFFYRLYYADWFIGLYMLMNGLLYSTLGSWMGYRIGSRLKQVMGT